MNNSWMGLGLVALVASVAQVQAQGLGGIFDRLGERVENKVGERLGGTTDKVVDGAFDKTEDTVKCVAGDQACTQKAAEQGKKVEVSQPAGVPSSAKCVATDVDCLKQAKAHGQTVEIVNEEDLDTMRCATQDSACLKRAKQLGKKVEITD